MEWNSGLYSYIKSNQTQVSSMFNILVLNCLVALDVAILISQSAALKIPLSP